jgi:hypothetical protein
VIRHSSRQIATKSNVGRETRIIPTEFRRAEQAHREKDKAAAVEVSEVSPARSPKSGQSTSDEQHWTSTNTLAIVRRDAVTFRSIRWARQGVTPDETGRVVHHIGYEKSPKVLPKVFRLIAAQSSTA